MPLALPLGVPGGIAPAFIKASSWLSPAGVLLSSPIVSCLVGAGALRGGCCGGAVVLRLDSSASSLLSIAAKRDSIGSGGSRRYWVRAAVTSAVLVVPWAVAVASSAVSKSGARRIVREGIAVKVQRQDNGNPAPPPPPRWWPCAKPPTLAPWREPAVCMAQGLALQGFQSAMVGTL
jgi:hypothetical protein